MTRRRRYHETGRGSFFGDLACDRVLERYRERFLVVLEKLFDWEAMSDEMIRLYRGQGEMGRPPSSSAAVQAAFPVIPVQRVGACDRGTG